VFIKSHLYQNKIQSKLIVVMILALQETTNTEDDSPEIIPQDDDEGPTCGCCGLRKWRTSWDLRLSVRYTATFEDLQDAAKSDCQDCELILEVILAYIAPKITLHKTRISVRPYPQERRIYVHLKPKWDSEEEYAELEVLRYSGVFAILIHLVQKRVASVFCCL
jgi:hypothetical protein